MATLRQLKAALRRVDPPAENHKPEPLSASAYEAGFDLFGSIASRLAYRDFIIPQLSATLETMIKSRKRLSVLEIGPGPESVVGFLSESVRLSINRYTAFEPNGIFADRLQAWLQAKSSAYRPLPCLDVTASIHQRPFGEDDTGELDVAEGFDVAVLCNSLYGVRGKTSFMRKVLQVLHVNGLAVVVHREGLHVEGLACKWRTVFPTATVSIPDDNAVIDRFAVFVAGLPVPASDEAGSITLHRRRLCRSLSLAHSKQSGDLAFRSPYVMLAFDQHASATTELSGEVPVITEMRRRKNWEAQLQHPAAIVKPETLDQIQCCVRWALQHKKSVTVTGGGHSGHGRQSHVVSIDMSAFDRVDIITGTATAQLKSEVLLVAEAGTTVGSVIQKATSHGLTVPLGARPSVGLGLWLQGGIGHLSRQYGLTCDAIIGVVMVSVASGRVLCLGHVPPQHYPDGALRPDDEEEILWAVKGAGTNLGVVVKVITTTFAAGSYRVTKWAKPLRDANELHRCLLDLNTRVLGSVPDSSSADFYLYYHGQNLCLGVTLFENGFASESATTLTPALASTRDVLGHEHSFQLENDVGLFGTDMYMTSMHGGHGGGKTRSFKRCVFIRNLGSAQLIKILAATLAARPSPQSYCHLLHGGGAVSRTASDATAFGCRGWTFACVVTGVWAPETEAYSTAGDVMRWVYDTVDRLMPFCCGIYGADLGPDPRDASLALRAFGGNLARLAKVKKMMDPENVLPYACPLQGGRQRPKAIVLVTGRSCAGKDFCATVWAAVVEQDHRRLHAQVVSISDNVKKDFALATGADAARLLRDREYKEKHRSALTSYYRGRLQQRPTLPKEQFLRVVLEAQEADIIFITGMRDEAPVATFGPLVPDVKMIEVRVRADARVTQARAVWSRTHGSTTSVTDSDGSCSRPDVTFCNERDGVEAAQTFAKDVLLGTVDEKLQLLYDMTPTVPNHPHPGMVFCNILQIPQRIGGLDLCTSLLEKQYQGGWSGVKALVCCEAAGFIFGSALASRMNTPLVPVRKAGRIPPPVLSIERLPSHISCQTPIGVEPMRFEMGCDAMEMIASGGRILVVDDVLASGNTMCAVLQLLETTGVDLKNVSVSVVAEFPSHRGRKLLHKSGFGQIAVQSLLVYPGS